MGDLTEHFADLRAELEEEARDPLASLDNSALSNEFRWMYSNSYYGSNRNFNPTHGDVALAKRCLKGMSDSLREVSGMCIEANRIFADYWTALNHFTIAQKITHAWWLQVTGVDSMSIEAKEMRARVLDGLWRRTKEHGPMEKLIRDRPEAKVIKKAYDQMVKGTPEAKSKKRVYDSAVKKTPEARARNAAAAKASRARRAGKDQGNTAPCQEGGAS